VTRQVFQFGPYRLDAGRRVLLRDHELIPLTPRAFDVLLYLVGNPDRTVGKDELLHAVWSDVAVTEGSLSQAISTLRKTLGDTPGDHEYVATVPRRGYRFVGEAALEEPGGAEPPSSREARPSPSWRGGKTWPLIAAASVLLILSAGLTQWRRARPRPVGRIESLAVLPLQNLSGDPAQQYFADGVTDALITELAKLNPLRVISRTSVMRFRKPETPITRIARELGVQAVVEGSVMRSGDRVRITIQLIDGGSDSHLWSESYDRDARDILTLQAEVARAIAGQIHVALAPGHLAPLPASRPVSLAAHEAYLRGRFFWNKRNAEGLQEALRQFHEALGTDAGYAAAHAGLADTYAVLPSYGLAPPEKAFPLARAAAARALELDDGLAEAHASLGFTRFHYDWDWEGALRELRRASDLNPSYATARQWHAEILAAQGRHAEALDEILEARRLDPLSVVIQTNVGRSLFLARRYEEAVRELEAATLMDRHFAWAYGLLAMARAHAGRTREAISAADTARDLGNGASEPLTYVEALAGDHAAARTRLRTLEDGAHASSGGAYYLAGIHALLGDRASTMRWLDRAIAERHPLIVFAGVDPAFDGVRADPAFAALLRRIGASPPVAAPPAVSRAGDAARPAEPGSTPSR
jgi:TolB-like protein/DNA-binding winged helix-turn-helix (wHTH) protein/Tfp pilus assembly protein PilF